MCMRSADLLGINTAQDATSDLPRRRPKRNARQAVSYENFNRDAAVSEAGRLL